MSLDNSKFKIYKIIHNNKPLTIFKFEPSYKGFSSFLKILDLPINILTLLIFLFKYKSISLVLDIFNGNLEDFAIEKNMVDHELEVLKNFEEFPTKKIHQYLFTAKKNSNHILKVANITHQRWFIKYIDHLLNTKFIELYIESSNEVAFLGIIPFPCIPRFSFGNLNFIRDINFLFSSFPVFLFDILVFIFFAFKTRSSIKFVKNNRLTIYKISKSKKTSYHNQINVSIYFFREVEILYEIISSLPDYYQFNIISLKRVKNIRSFFEEKGMYVFTEEIETRRISYYKSFIINFSRILIYPVNILLKNKSFNASFLYGFFYNIFAIESLTQVTEVGKIIEKKLQPSTFLSFNSWELPFLFYYKFLDSKSIGRYYLAPATFYSLFFRPHDLILTINKSHYKKLGYLHNNSVFLLGKKNQSIQNFQQDFKKKLDLESLKYVIWVATKRCPGISNLMLHESLEKTIDLCKSFNLKLIIRSHPTISKDNINELFGDILSIKYLFDNDSAIEEIAKKRAIFSLTTSSADLSIFKKFNLTVCFGFDKVVTSRYGMPYKKILGDLCTHNVKIAIKEIQEMNNFDVKYELYKKRILNYLEELNHSNKDFDKDLSNIFANDLE